jgi:hypothetical protein
MTSPDTLLSQRLREAAARKRQAGMKPPAVIDEALHQTHEQKRDAPLFVLARCIAFDSQT